MAKLKKMVVYIPPKHVCLLRMLNVETLLGPALWSNLRQSNDGLDDAWIFVNFHNRLPSVHAIGNKIEMNYLGAI